MLSSSNSYRRWSAMARLYPTRVALRYPAHRLTGQSRRRSQTEMVDFRLTDEQKNLRELAHDFAEKEIRPVAWEYDKDGTWPEEILRKAWEVGLMNTHVPEEYGGPGLGYFDGCLIEEELSWGCSGIQTSLGCNGLAAASIMLGGSGGIKKKDLGAVTEGVKLGRSEE